MFVTRPLNYDTVEEFAIVKAELIADDTKLVVVGKDANDVPVKTPPTYVGNEVSQEIVFGAILAQLGAFGEFKTLKSMVNAINDYPGSMLKVKLIKEEYIDSKTLKPMMGTKAIFDVTKF